MKRILVCMLLPLWLAGCMSFNASSMHPVRTALKEQYPDIRIDKEFELTVGASLLGLVNMVIDDDDMDFDLSKLDRAEVGVYEIRNLPSLDDFEMPLEKIKVRHCPVMEELVHIREDDEYVLVVGCTQGDKLHNIFLVVIDSEELILVNASGDYDEIIKLAMNTGNPDHEHFNNIGVNDRETRKHEWRVH